MRREVETGEGIFDRKAVSAAVQFVRERCRWEDHDRYEREIPHGNSLYFRNRRAIFGEVAGETQNVPEIKYRSLQNFG